MRAPPATYPPSPGRERTHLMRAEMPAVPYYRFLYNTVGGQWLWWLRRSLDDAELARIIHDPRVEVWVLFASNQPAGFAELDFRQAPRSVDLAYFGLMPSFIGRGLGPYLLGEALERAWIGRPERITVNTNTLDHPKALPLYKRMGFVPIREEPVTFNDPCDLGLIDPAELEPFVADPANERG